MEAFGDNQIKTLHFKIKELMDNWELTGHWKLSEREDMEKAIGEYFWSAVVSLLENFPVSWKAQKFGLSLSVLSEYTKEFSLAISFNCVQIWPKDKRGGHFPFGL